MDTNKLGAIVQELADVIVEQMIQHAMQDTKKLIQVAASHPDTHAIFGIEAYAIAIAISAYNAAMTTAPMHKFDQIAEEQFLQTFQADFRRDIFELFGEIKRVHDNGGQDLDVIFGKHNILRAMEIHTAMDVTANLDAITGDQETTA